MGGRLQDKVAVVLGAAGKDNMGQTIARRFAAEGAKVVVAGRHEAALRDLADEIGGAAALCDITSRTQIEDLARTAKDRYGGLDIAVQATGWGLMSTFEETDDDMLDRMMAVQFKGPFQFFQVMVANMDRGGSLVQISSATATIMLNNHAAYMGTKAGIDHVIRCIAHEYGARGIRANSISPGLTDTPMASDAIKTPGLLEAFVKEYPLGRINTADDIANAALWVASDECFMTGENLQVNGGLTLRRNPSADEIAASVGAAMAHAGTTVGSR